MDESSVEKGEKVQGVHSVTLKWLSHYFEFYHFELLLPEKSLFYHFFEHFPILLTKITRTTKKERKKGRKKELNNKRIEELLKIWLF